MRDLKIVIKGAGEMATGIACRLFMANLKLLVMMENSAADYCAQNRSLF